MPVQISNTIDIPGFEKDLWQRLESALQWVGNDMVAAVRQYLDDEEINVDGGIKKSLHAEVQQMVGQLTMRIGPNVHYAIYRHEGTRPHWAPIDPIRVWVVKKLGFTGKEAEKVAFQVQWKIAHDGTEGKPFMLSVYKAYKPKIIDLLIHRIGLA